MVKRKTPIKQNINFVIILLSTLLLFSIFCICLLLNQNKVLRNNTEENLLNLNDIKTSESVAIDNVLSQNEAKKIFCSKNNSHIKISGDFEESWQVRITEWGKSDEFGLKEYRVDKVTGEVTENPY